MLGLCPNDQECLYHHPKPLPALPSAQVLFDPPNYLSVQPSSGVGAKLFFSTTPNEVNSADKAFHTLHHTPFHTNRNVHSSHGAKSAPASLENNQKEKIATILLNFLIEKLMLLHPFDMMVAKTLGLAKRQLSNEDADGAAETVHHVLTNPQLLAKTGMSHFNLLMEARSLGESIQHPLKALVSTPFTTSQKNSSKEVSEKFDLGF